MGGKGRRCSEDAEYDNMNAKKLAILSAIAALAMVFAAAAVVQGSEDSAADDAYQTLVVGDGDGEYATIAAALEKAGNGDHIQLAKDVEEDVTIAAGNVVLDLNGHKLTNVSDDTITVALGAELTITGNGTVDNLSHGKADVFNNGTVTIQNGTFTRSMEAGKDANDSGGNSYYNIVNHGKMTIGDATVYSTGHFSSLIENGYYEYSKTSEGDRSAYIEGTNQAAPSLTIAGGSFSGGINTVKNDDGGVLEINGGTFENVTQACVLNHNIATITGGIFDAIADDGKVYRAIINCGCDAATDIGKLTISGGDFKGYFLSVSDDNGTIEINGGTFSEYPILYNGNATMTKAADVKLSAPIGYSWNDDGKLVINQYKVTYLVNGEAVGEIENYDYKSEVSVREALEETGYTITPWSTDDIEVTDGKFVIGTSDVTFKATKTPNKYGYTINYLDKDKNVLAEAVSGTADFGMTFEAPLAAVVGYTAPEIQSLTITADPESNVVTYVYTINSYGYTVKYVDADGNEIAPDFTGKANYGATVEAPIIAVDGYTAPTVQVILKITENEADNVFSYPYTINSYGYTVKYVDADGNEIADAATGKAVFGTAVTPEVPAIDGYTAPAAQTITIASDVSKNVVTYTYSINSYVLTYLTAGDVVLSELTVEYNSSVTAPADPVREGSYAFAGWFLNGSACTFPFEMPANDVTLVATWDVVIPDADSETDIISVNVDANGAPISSDSMQAIVSSAESDENVTLEVSIGSGITVVFDNAAIRNFGTGAAELTANEISSDELTDAVRNIVGDGTVYSISFGSNTNFGEGTATVTLPYALADGMDAAGLYIAYIYDGQVAETFDCTYSDDGTVTFTTGHFSTYAIMYEEPSDDNDDEFIFALIVAVVIVIAVFGAVFLAQRSGKY
jgi:hypothetical protein